MKLFFQAPSSSFDPSFWEELYKIKLNIIKLDSTVRNIYGHINLYTSKSAHSLFKFSSSSYDSSSANNNLFNKGSLYDVNTIEEFRDFDKKLELKKLGYKLLLEILKLESILLDPSKLLTFLLLTYSDLKSYRFTYWLGVPAIIPLSSGFNHGSSIVSLKSVMINYAHNDINLCIEIYRLLINYINKNSQIKSSPIQTILGIYFPSHLNMKCSIEETEDILLIPSPSSYTITTNDNDDFNDFSSNSSSNKYNPVGQILTLKECWYLRYDPNLYFVIFESSLPTSTNNNSSNSTGLPLGGLGWMLRNFLTMLSIHSIPHNCSHIAINIKDIDSSSLDNTIDNLKKLTSRIISLKGNFISSLFESFNTTNNKKNYHQSFENISNIDIIDQDQSSFCTVDIDDLYQELKHVLYESSIVLNNNIKIANNNNNIDNINNNDNNHINNNNFINNNINNKIESISSLLSPEMESKLMNTFNVVGWEMNERGKPGPKIADLSQSLDHNQLMRQAVHLNINLMKWRLWPDLNTNIIANTKCLLLGAGTLGCAVGRNLLGWGIRHITFVDNGKPARQCLFEFQDCVNREYKSIAAAKALKRIFPEINCTGIILNIPMPGHPLNNIEYYNNCNDDNITNKDIFLDHIHNNKINKAMNQDIIDYYRLEDLIASHDVCFTLTDSREARWLPTMLCTSNRKLLINSALGFDSYLVMYHQQHQQLSIYNNNNNNNQGCYFCNDIVAAANSQKDRSLDQQCTVTRPGLSFIAAGLAVEMMISILQKNYNNSNNNSISSDNKMNELIPSQIRGSLHNYTQIRLHTTAFKQCTACSDLIIEQYHKDGFRFILEVCKDPSILEKLSGITALMESIDMNHCCIDDSDDDNNEDF